MPRRKNTKSKCIGADKQGRYFRNLGYIKSRSLKYTQKKFYLGYDEDVARLAATRLEALWYCVKEIQDRVKTRVESCIIGAKDEKEIENANYDLEVDHGSNGQLEFRREIGRPIWTEFTLVLAEAIRQGEPTAKIPVDVIRNLPEYQDMRIDSSYVLSPWLDRVRRLYPIIHIEIENEPLNAECETSLQDKAFRLLAEGSRLSAEPLVNQKLHYAIGTYVDHVKKNTLDPDGETSEWGHTKIRQIEFVKTHSVDVDLSQLGGPTIDSMLSILSKRPLTQRGNHCSKSYVKSCNKELKVFLTWLDKSDKYHWKWPVDFEYKPPRATTTPQELLPTNRSRKRKLKTYNVDELATLYEYATPIQRAYLVLCLNCGFANAELTTLLCDDIFLRQPHPDQDILHVDISNENSWIARERTKTHVLGTWKLWPESIHAIEWWLQERRIIEERYQQNATRTTLPFEQVSKGRFFITSAGKPIAEKGRRTGRIPNSWNSLLARVIKDKPDFKKLSVKYLRKTGSTLIRELSRRELAKVYLSQGKPRDENDEVESYANLPYRQFFDVLDELHFLLKPVWATVEDPFPIGRKLGGKDNLPPDQIKRILRLRSKGVSASDIAEELGINKSTVYRRCSSLAD